MKKNKQNIERRDKTKGKRNQSWKTKEGTKERQRNFGWKKQRWTKAGEKIKKKKEKKRKNQKGKGEEQKKYRGEIVF